MLAVTCLHLGTGFVGRLRAAFCPGRNGCAAERLPAESFDEPLPRHPSIRKDLALSRVLYPPGTPPFDFARLRPSLYQARGRLLSRPSVIRLAVVAAVAVTRLDRRLRLLLAVFRQ